MVDRRPWQSRPLNPTIAIVCMTYTSSYSPRHHCAQTVRVSSIQIVNHKAHTSTNTLTGKLDYIYRNHLSLIPMRPSIIRSFRLAASTASRKPITHQIRSYRPLTSQIQSPAKQPSQRAKMSTSESSSSLLLVTLRLTYDYR